MLFQYDLLYFRFRELELQTPAHNVTARHHKVAPLVDKEQPNVGETKS